MVNGLQEFSALEESLHREVRILGVPGRWLLLVMFIGSVILGFLVFIWALGGLSGTVTGSSVPDTTTVQATYYATIVNMLLFSVSVGNNLGAIFRSGRRVADGGVAQNP